MVDTRIILVDDHPVLRAGIKSSFDGVEGVSIVGEAGDGAEALAIVRDLRPDIAIIDITMNGIDGIELTRRICEDFPHTKVIILSMHEEVIYAVNAFKAGAKAYVTKKSLAGDILEAVDDVLDGKRFASQAISNELLSEYIDRVLTTDIVVDPIDTLTKREKEVLKYIADGTTSKEIAVKLYISLATVKSHRINLMRKLNVHDVAGLVKIALQHGFV